MCNFSSKEEATFLMMSAAKVGLVATLDEDEEGTGAAAAGAAFMGARASIFTLLP